MELKYHKMYDDVIDLSFATQQSACFDLRAYFGTHERLVTVYTPQNIQSKYLAHQIYGDDPYQLVLNPKDRAMIPTGIKLDIPEGYSVKVYSRSGLSLKSGLILVNGVGVIDSDYINQIYILLLNDSDTPVKILHGDRIAQAELVVKQIYTLGIGEEPIQKTDRVGGFGSTGVK